MPSPHTTQFLAQFGISADDAREVIVDHLDNPAAIYAAADSIGLKFDIIADLLGVEQSLVNSYFAQAGLSPAISALAPYGLTLGDVRPLVNQFASTAPTELYDAAVAFGLRLDVLAEISGSLSAGDFQSIFAAHGLDTSVLGGTSGGNPGVPLVGSDLPAFFQHLVGFNDQAGALSTEAIRTKVLDSGVSLADYNAAFDPTRYAGSADGTFSTDDLGFSHLGSFTATGANLESLYYGTLIRTFNAIDAQEMDEIIQFTNVHAAELQAGNEATLTAYFGLLQTVYEDPAVPPLLEPEVLSDMLAFTTSAWIQYAGGEYGPLFGLGMLDTFG
ncbi:hypothetical protein [Xenophilus sp. Marseille-Q4582]|uniref:hypothetical protein n=1 Tax=Xenophilus sp. Marseille-Q4582 TaxID=2866600 RepID=UPI001CE41D22|nr:hypothetical protein [Xenophilus sp. Marseille-Q4582]